MKQTKKTKSSASQSEESDSQPKYRHISETLRQAIAEGEYRHGTRLPSEAQLVRRFGASRMTVVKAVRELQQMGLVDRKVGSGTYVTTAPSKQSYQFGLLIAELGQTEIFEPICRGMANSPLAAKCSLIWGNAISDAQKKEQSALMTSQQFVDQRVSGVFFAPLELTPRMDEVNRKIVAELDRAKIPVVLLDRCYARYPARSKYDLVGIDNRAAAYIATEHLIRMGARRISFFAKPLSAATVDARISGYHEALRANSLLSNENLVARGDPSDESIVSNVVRRLKPDAFLCANDLTAAHLMQSLLSLGRKVPEEIRIVGFDDIKYASLLPIPLTTQHQPCLDIGAIAMRTMIDRVQTPELPTREITLNCSLVIRRSCGSPKREHA